MQQTVNASDLPGVLGDGVNDDAPAINAALAAGKVVRLAAATYALGAALVLGVSGGGIVGDPAGGSLLTPLATFSAAGIPYPAMVYAGPVGQGAPPDDVLLQDFSIDGAKLHPGGTGKLSGVVIDRCRRFLRRRLTVRNCTGYGLWATGAWNSANPAGTVYVSGTDLDNFVANCNVGIEHTAAEDCRVDDCEVAIGDGDIPAEACFHPLIGSRRITYVRPKARGTGDTLGFHLAPFEGPMGEIIILDPDVETANVALSVVNGTVARLRVHDGRFVSSNNDGARITEVGDCLLADSYFEGWKHGVTGNNSAIRGTNSTAKGKVPVDGQLSAYGLVAWSGTADWHGELLAEGPAGKMYAWSPGGGVTKWSREGKLLGPTGLPI